MIWQSRISQQESQSRSYRRGPVSAGASALSPVPGGAAAEPSAVTGGRGAHPAAPPRRVSRSKQRRVQHRAGAGGRAPPALEPR